MGQRRVPFVPCGAPRTQARAEACLQDESVRGHTEGLHVAAAAALLVHHVRRSTRRHEIHPHHSRCACVRACVCVCCACACVRACVRVDHVRRSTTKQATRTHAPTTTAAGRLHSITCVVCLRAHACYHERAHKIRKDAFHVGKQNRFLPRHSKPERIVIRGTSLCLPVNAIPHTPLIPAANGAVPVLQRHEPRRIRGSSVESQDREEGMPHSALPHEEDCVGGEEVEDDVEVPVEGGEQVVLPQGGPHRRRCQRLCGQRPTTPIKP